MVNDSEHFKNVYELLVFLLLRTLCLDLYPLPLFLSFKEWFCSSLKENSQGSQAVKFDSCLDIKDGEEKEKKPCPLSQADMEVSHTAGRRASEKAWEIPKYRKSILGLWAALKRKEQVRREEKVILF